MFSYDKLYVNAETIAVDATLIGDTVTLLNSADKPDCVRLYIKYTPGAADRTLTISLEEGSLLESTEWYIPATDPTTDIVGAGSAVDSFVALTLGIAGVSQFRLKFASTGESGDDDEISVTIGGLPTTGVTFS